MMTLGQRDKCM